MTGYSHSIEVFERLLSSSGISASSSSILCRSHEQLEKIRGNVNFTDLEGQTLNLARASFLRDIKKDFKKSTDIVESVLRNLVGDIDMWDRIDADPDSEESFSVRLILWQFVKSESGFTAD